jgi:Coenzyme PQQ synthesis protein D (PqqD)
METGMQGGDERPRGGSGARWLEPADDVVGQRLGDEVVLVNLKTNRIFELNRTGGRFWDLLHEEGNRDQIEARLRKEFDVGDEHLTAEVDALIARLAAEDLVRIVERE